MNPLKKIDDKEKRLRFYLQRVNGLYKGALISRNEFGGVAEDIEKLVEKCDDAIMEACSFLAEALEKYENKNSCKECKICYYEKRIPVWESGELAEYIEVSWNQTCRKKTADRFTRMRTRKRSVNLGQNL